MRSPTKGLCSTLYQSAERSNLPENSKKAMNNMASRMVSSGKGNFFRYRAALNEARAVDQELQRCRTDVDAMRNIRLHKPFLGVPITTKNALAVKGECRFQLADCLDVTVLRLIRHSVPCFCSQVSATRRDCASRKV